jgi:hypothetical protein
MFSFVWILDECPATQFNNLLGLCKDCAVVLTIYARPSRCGCWPGKTAESAKEVLHGILHYQEHELILKVRLNLRRGFVNEYLSLLMHDAARSSNQVVLIEQLRMCLEPNRSRKQHLKSGTTCNNVGGICLAIQRACYMMGFFSISVSSIIQFR